MRYCAAAILLCLGWGQVQKAGADDGWLHQSREPLLDRRGNMAFEGRQIILATDAYPRAAARLVDGPTIRHAVRTRGCGVLGANAPEPFRKDALVKANWFDPVLVPRHETPSASRGW